MMAPIERAIVSIMVSVLLFCPSSTQLTVLFSESLPVVNPMGDQFIAVNSEENATYTCTVDSTSTVVWEVERSQIRSNAQFMEVEDLGFFIEPMNTRSNFSKITISPLARVNNSEILVQCLASQGINSIEGEIYRVVTFVAPEVPNDLDLEPALTLEWNRPLNIAGPENIAVNYTVTINSIDGSGMNFQNVTSMTSISVRFLEEILITQGSECVEFEFFVSATNDAGTGQSARIQDTVPISPDVTEISNVLKVERVDIQTSTVDISFPPLQPCSTNFPLTNYTLNINRVVSRILSSNEVMPGVPVTLSGLARDNSFSLTVTACNEVTCRTSESRILNTTDVQSAEVVFFENRLFLRCSFADNSQAQGCIIRLTLSSTNETERFQISRRSGSLCTTANNQREAYSSVVILDWEENGMEGNVSLDTAQTVVNVSTLEQYTEITGCRDIVVDDNTAEIVGGVLGATAGIVIVIAVLGYVLFIYYGRKLKKTKIHAPFTLLPGISKFMPANYVSNEEKDPLMSQKMYQCEVDAGDCGERIKECITSHDQSLTKASSPVSGLTEANEEVQKVDDHIWLGDPHDASDPLTVNIRWKPFVQALIALNRIHPDQIPRDKDFSKLKMQLHFDDK